MSATVLSFFRPAPTTVGDWSHQELAEFYRVEAASTQAGLRLSLDRGLSDEGEPWIAFCREDGDVFLHFARIDGAYVIAGDLFNGPPLVGPDFRALLAELVRRHPSVLPLPRLGATSERTGAQILMHPAALLAAIVATACLFVSMDEAVASEFDVGPAPAPDATPASATVALFGSQHTLPSDGETYASTARTSEGHDREFALITSVIIACITASVVEHGEAIGPTNVASIADVVSDTAVAKGTSVAASGHLQPTAADTVAIVANKWLAQQAVVPATPETEVEQHLQSPLRDLRDTRVVLPSATVAIIAGAIDGTFTTSRMIEPEARSGFQTGPALGMRFEHAAASHAVSGASGHERSAPLLDAVGEENRASAPSAPASMEKLHETAHVTTGSNAASADIATTRVVAKAIEGDDARATTPASSEVPATATSKVSTVSNTVFTISPSETVTKVNSNPYSDISALSAKTFSLLLHALIDQPGQATKATLAPLGEAIDLKADTSSKAVAKLTATATSASPDSTMDHTQTSALSTPAVAKSASSGDHEISEGTAVLAMTTKVMDTSASAPTSKVDKTVPEPVVAKTDSDAGTLTHKVVAATADTGTTTHEVATAKTVESTSAAIKGSVTDAIATSTSNSGQEKASTSPVVDQAIPEISHADAVHAIAALVSTTNTVSRAVSISLAGEAAPLDAAQLQIIDLFLSTTPSVKFRMVDSALEIYDPSASAEVSAHSSVWDIGGGTLVRVVGITDGHVAL